MRLSAGHAPQVMVPAYERHAAESGGGGGGEGGGGDGHAVEWLADPNLAAEGAPPPAWAQSSWLEPKLPAFDLVGISPGGRRRGRFHRVSAHEALEAARLRPDAP